MSDVNYIVIGANGLVGKSIVKWLIKNNKDVLSINRSNYDELIGSKCSILINANGNSYRYKANNDPFWDFKESFLSVQKSIKDFKFDKYVYISTVDTYNYLDNLDKNHEKTIIKPEKLDYYGFHKWLSEKLIKKYCDKYLIMRMGTIIGNDMKKGPIHDIINQNPLNMSLDSNLTFINVENIPIILSKLLSLDLKNQIYNVTGLGYIKINEIKSVLHKIYVNKNSKTYSYNINIDKLRSIINMPTSKEVVFDFLEKTLWI